MRYSTHSCLVLLLALAVATLCAGFQSSSSPLLVVVSRLSQRTTTNPIAGQSQPQTTPTCVLKMSEDEEAVEEGEAQQAKEPVVCPDCDLCDGSGRYVLGLCCIASYFVVVLPICTYSLCFPHCVSFFCHFSLFIIHATMNNNNNNLPHPNHNHTRIAGGIGALVPWIPIKAYRPCPNFVDRGGNYQRAGQPLDEIAFGKKNVDKWG